MPGGYLSGDGAWGTAGNWSTAAIPITGSDAIIPGSLTSDVTDAGTDADNIDLALLYTHRDYTGSFGSTGSPIKTAGSIVKFFSSGPCYFECDKGGAAIKTDYLTIALAQARLVCEIGGSSGDEGDIDFIRCLRGIITLKGSIVFGASGWVQVGYVQNFADDCRVTIAATAPTLPDLWIWGGECTAHNVLTTVRVENGTLLKKTAALTTAYIGPGGILKYEHENTDTTPQIHVFAGGHLDLLSNSVPKTLGNVRLYPGSTIAYDPDLHTITLEDMRDAV